MEELVFTLPAREKKPIIIEEKEYFIFPYISVHDLELLVGCADKSEEECRRAASLCLLSKVTPKSAESYPDLSCIMNLPDSTFETFCELIAESDDSFRKHFSVLDPNLSVFRRLAKAAEQENKEMVERMAEQLVHITDITKKITVDFSSSIKAITDSAMTAYTNSIKSWFSFDGIFKQLSDIVSSFHIPSISDKRKKEIQDSHREWGRYGWTQPLCAPDTFLDEPPESSTDATKKALAFCNKTAMDELFAELYTLPHAKKLDIDEAIFDFEHKQYKSCAVILFGLIDARLIRLQRKKDIPVKKNRPSKRAVGKTAVDCIFDRIAREQNIYQKIFMLFTYQNLLACLSAMFADTDDFSKQPRVINRHLLDHGMLRRRVIRKDCVQLFLLYYNLLSFLDLCFGKTADDE